MRYGINAAASATCGCKYVRPGWTFSRTQPDFCNLWVESNKLLRYLLAPMFTLLDFISNGGSMIDPALIQRSGISRRNFLAQASCFGAFYGIATRIPMALLSASLAADSRISQAPIADKGFAAVRKIGDGLYATISDPSKGETTMCNGGFLAGKDGALLIEGFVTPGGASFQMETLRAVSKVPVKAALDTHYHFDHSMGNAFYGANGVPLWGHAATAKRIVDSYAMMQGTDKAATLAPYEKRIADAKSDIQLQQAQSELEAAARW